MNDIARIPIVTIVLILLLGGCAYAPKNQQNLVDNSMLPKGWTYPQTKDTDAVVNLFGIAEAAPIKTIVSDALVANPNLQQVALRLKSAQVYTQIRRADRLPQLNANGGLRRQSVEGKISNSPSLSLSLQWEVDVWGRLADAQASGDLNEEAFAEDFKAARNSLAGRVIQRILDIGITEKIIQVEQERLQTLTFNEQFIRDRYLVGLGDLSDLEAARSVRAKSVATIRQREEILAQTKRALGVLRGDIELKTDSLPNSVFDIKIPLAPMPSTLIGQRPDVRAALLRIQAADLDTHVAYKSLLPSVTLSADLAQSGRSVSDVFKADPAWNFLAGLTVPLFQGGRLKAQAQSAKYEAERVYWFYQETLILALQEVENALGQEQSLSDQQQALSEALQHAQRNQHIYENRYKEGLADILDLLNAQQGTYDRKIELLEIKLARKNNRINLGLAIGLGV